MFVESYCKQKDYNFIRYDNYGHGASSGKFIDQTISSWLEGLLFVIEQLTTGPVILIDSSPGAWISFLAGIVLPQRVAGIITISAAFDFTEELIWNGIGLEQKAKLKKDGACEIGGANPD